MTASLAGPFLIVCTILALGGVAKLVAPTPARQALRVVGVAVPVAAVRLLGLAEVALACAAGFSGGTFLPIGVGMAYVAFAVFVVLMLRTATGTSCGCFGRSDTPPSWFHVAVNAASAGLAFAAAGVPALGDTISAQPAGGLPFLGLVALGSYALLLALTALPVLFAPPASAVPEFTVTERIAS